MDWRRSRDSSVGLAMAKPSDFGVKTDYLTRTCATSCEILMEPFGSRPDSDFVVSCRTCSAGNSIVERLYTKKDGMLNEGIFSLCFEPRVVGCGWRRSRHFRVFSRSVTWRRSLH